MTNTLTDQTTGSPGPPSSSTAVFTPAGIRGQPPTGRRRFSWVVLGLFLIAGSILVFVFWSVSQNQRVPVLVAGSDIAAGSVIDRGDVKLVPVNAEEGIDLLGRDDQEVVVGARARVDIPADTPLAGLLVVDDQGIPEGFDVVGAALRAGEYPVSQLSIGDEVFLLRVETIGTAGDEGPTELGAATIWAIEGLEAQAEPRLFLSLLVPQEARLDVANAIAQQRLRITLVKGEA